MLATELLALLHNTPCQGQDCCHWCGAACERFWVHDEPLQIPFSKGRSSARCPGSAYICKGCWLYRRRRVTYSFLSKGFKDSQCLEEHSWLLTEQNIWILQTEDYPTLWSLLLIPPLRFALSLRTDKEKNEIHRIVLNDFSEIKASTQLAFHINNQLLGYTVYELENALQKGPNGSQPGVHALLRILGRPPVVKQEEKRERGRPTAEDGKITQKLIRVSGQPLAFKCS